MSRDERKEQIANAVEAHVNWKMWLKRMALRKTTDVSVEQISDSSSCPFGKWLASAKFAEDERDLVREVVQLHDGFHSEAGRVAEMIRLGQFAEALEALENGPYAQKSDALKERLMDWQLGL